MRIFSVVLIILLVTAMYLSGQGVGVGVGPTWGSDVIGVGSGATDTGVFVDAFAAAFN